jgi:hypothetical protein
MLSGPSMIDPNLDTVLRVAEIFSIIGGGGLVAFRLGRSTAQMHEATLRQSAEIEDLKVEIKQLGAILTKLAVQEERLNTLTRWYDELRHGSGFVRGQIGVEREYP